MSDHNVLFCTFNIQYSNLRPSLRREIFKFKEEVGQDNFARMTSGNNFSHIFAQETSLPQKAGLFFSNLKKVIHKSFRKVRIVNGGKQKNEAKSQIQIMMDKRKELKLFLKSCTCKALSARVRSELNLIEQFIGNTIGDRNAKIVASHVKGVEDNGGNLSHIKLWDLKKKLCPQQGDPPMAKRDELGNLISAPEALKSLYARTYSRRLRSREMSQNLMDVYILKEELWSSRLKCLSNVKSEEWSPNKLINVLKQMKNNKSADPNLMINEIFKEGFAGQDLQTSLLLLFNGIKNSSHIPSFLSNQDICTIFKKKGSRLDMKNDRGIFILTSLRRILDKLLYNDLYDDIDRNMSDCNIGARKGRQVKNHLFIIHSIINSVINGKNDPIDIQFYDLEQAFDALWLTDCMNDVFDTLPSDKRDDRLSLLFTSSIENNVAVRTPYGLTERMLIPKIVKQGGTWGPVLCSNSIDVIGKKVWSSGQHCYLYRNSVRILPLAMVDDICTISKCGLESLKWNSYINTHAELKKLRFHVPDQNGRSKCHKLHIGCKSRFAPNYKFMAQKWKRLMLMITLVM